MVKLVYTRALGARSFGSESSSLSVGTPMHIEFEATFSRIDKEEIRKKLQEIGATLVHPEFLMTRVVFHPPLPIEGGWLRVRQEADKITMSLKVVNGSSIEDQKEVELEIQSVEEGVKFLDGIGAKQKAYQETLRETWKLNTVTVTIDTWPGLFPFVEVEGESEEKVKEVALQLGFSWDNAKFCEVSTLYKEELGIPQETMKNHMPVITFNNPPTQYAGLA